MVGLLGVEIWPTSYAGVVADFWRSLDASMTHPAEVPTMSEQKFIPEVCTADDPHVAKCGFVAVGIPKIEHDYRPYTQLIPGRSGKTHTFLRCVFCHAVTCGDADETDPCIEPYHHPGYHRTRLGVTWPKGGVRPGTLTSADTP